MNCSYCCGTEGTRRVSFERRERILSELLSYSFDSISFTGGNPLLRWDDLRKLLPRVEDLHVTIDTNGSFVTEEIAEELATYDHLELHMTLNGSRPEIHDQSRGEGTFDDVVRAAGILDEYGIDFGFGTTLLPSNVDDIEDICERAAELGGDGVGFNGYLPVGNVTGQDEFLLTPEEYRDAVRELKRCHDRWKGTLSVSVGSNIPFSFLPSDELREFYLEMGDDVSMCAMGQKVYVAPTGNVIPCLYIHDPLGNILEDDLETIFASEEMERYREAATSAPKGDPCSQCAFEPACGGCPAASLAIEGDVNDGDPRCWNVSG